MHKIIITGYVCRDIEQKTTNNARLKKFVVAVSVNQKKTTLYYNVNLWNNTCDAIVPYLKKGVIVTVVGNLREPKIYTTATGDQKVDKTVDCDSISFNPSNTQNQEKKHKESLETKEDQEFEWEI